MLKIKPQNPKGVRDYLPTENAKREYIIGVIKKHFELFGFHSIYNPVFERLETLQGKYGEEGDKLLFKILNSGEYLKKQSKFIELSVLLKRKLEYIIQTELGRLEHKHNWTKFGIEKSDIEINYEEIKQEFSYFLYNLKISEFSLTINQEGLESHIFEFIENQVINNKLFNFWEERTSLLEEFCEETVNHFFLSKENLFFLEAKYITKEISEKGLRYDHTVPLARFVAQHQNDLTFPFKRFVIGPVWRADRPQKGRYQEFFQCDADIVGSKGLVGDVEMITLIDSVFSELNLKVEIKINNRKIYNGICQSIGIEESQTTLVSTILDKWDKIGEEKVREELEKIIGQEKADKLIVTLSIKDLEEFAKNSNEEIQIGVEEIRYIQKYSSSNSLKFDPLLLRGLDYYTGTVIEIVSTEMEYGSIGGGGRYDNLTEIFGLKDMSGIGISFGLDRVYDVMTELKRFPENSDKQRILILNLTENATSRYFSLLRELRAVNKVVDLYPSIAKMDKQLTYADKAGYTHAILIGEDELSKNQVQIKNLKERRQESIDIKNLSLKL